MIRPVWIIWVSCPGQQGLFVRIVRVVTPARTDWTDIVAQDAADESLSPPVRPSKIPGRH